jgi:hypothetical protein
LNQLTVSSDYKQINIGCEKMFVIKHVPRELIKGKVFLAPGHEPVLRVELYIQAFLTSRLYSGEWSASRLGRFKLKQRAHDIHWIGELVGYRSVWVL